MKEEAYKYKPLQWVALSLALSWVPWAVAIVLGADQEEAEAYSFQGAVFAFAILGLFGPMIASADSMYEGAIMSGAKPLERADDGRSRPPSGGVGPTPRRSGA